MVEVLDYNDGLVLDEDHISVEVLVVADVADFASLEVIGMEETTNGNQPTAKN